MFKLFALFALVLVTLLRGTICAPLVVEGGADIVARDPQTETLTGLADIIVGEVEGLVAAVLGETPPEVPGLLGQLGLQ